MADLSKYSAVIENLRVLVTDDQLMMRTVISQDLRNMGFVQIDTAPNGREAWRLIDDARRSNHPYSMVFLDWNMPELDGLGVLTKCRAEKKLDNMAVVMITAEQEKKNVLKAISTGATSYIVKPVSRDALQKNVERIFEWLAKRHAI